MNLIPEREYAVIGAEIELNANTNFMDDIRVVESELENGDDMNEYRRKNLKRLKLLNNKNDGSKDSKLDHKSPYTNYIRNFYAKHRIDK